MCRYQEVVRSRLQMTTTIAMMEQGNLSFEVYSFSSVFKAHFVCSLLSLSCSSDLCNFVDGTYLSRINSATGMLNFTVIIP